MERSQNIKIFQKSSQSIFQPIPYRKHSFHKTNISKNGLFISNPLYKQRLIPSCDSNFHPLKKSFSLLLKEKQSMSPKKIKTKNNEKERLCQKIHHFYSKIHLEMRNSNNNIKGKNNYQNNTKIKKEKDLKRKCDENQPLSCRIINFFNNIH